MTAAFRPSKCGNYSALASRKPRSPAAFRLVGHRCAAFWQRSDEESAKDPIREDRIHDEAIVDAYGPEEKAMSWYYYLETRSDSLSRPGASSPEWFRPSKKGETVEVRRLAPEDACDSDMLVLVRWQGRKMAVPLSQVAAIDPDESTEEAIGDWHYWVARGYLF